MILKVAIETHDRMLGYEMFGDGKSLSQGAVAAIPGGARAEYVGSLVRKAVGIPEVLQFIVDAATNVELALVATWLYDKVKGKNVESIVVNRRVVTEITEEGIYQALEEEIKVNK